MATYVMLFRYTEQGIRAVKESPSRVNTVKQLFHSLGAEVRHFYAVMGQYDTIFVVEAPNDETIAKAALAVASQGYVRTETLRAFTEDEFRKITTALP